MYEIKLGVKATRQFKKLDPQIKKKIKKKIENTLGLDPSKFPFLSSTFSKLRKLKIPTPGGQYRAVYTIKEKEEKVLVVFIGTRENFYKELRNYLE